MASGTKQTTAFLILLLNLGLYTIITIIAAWAVNHGIQRSRESASGLSVPLQIFPIYFPFGNMATGFFVIFSLLAGVVGMGTSLIGLQHVKQWDISGIYAVAASSMMSWSLTLLAMGFACKEINLGYRDSNLRTLEVVTIIAGATHMIGTGAIHAGVGDAIADAQQRLPGPRS
ncbi:hypothetical protein HS088_TW01G00226 [Tripterygium wilfordii]|uniref:AWPM-19-like family protein n=1 Tax=Tripterygium wilfordii TaxID=458696 RepID=A0A7J7E138_TRIWF|nr:membrane protein PM19L [Tripterygium wilfordii]KAF5752318.1 hypothetical protein HS088_TW01G00226 [Tripterygium wilfordii]